MSTNIRQAAIGDEALLAGLNRFVQELHIASRPDHFKPTQSEELATSFLDAAAGCVVIFVAFVVKM